MHMSTAGNSHTSSILKSLVEASSAQRITVRDMVSALGQRAYALLLVILGLPNCLPMPPPIPLVCGLLILFVAMQMLLGFSAPWLPRRVLDLSVARESASRLMGRAYPWLERMERFAKPRIALLQTAAGLRLIGTLVLVCALALLVAAPFIGQIPLGIAICLMGLGLVERDGLIIGIASVFGALGVVFSIIFAWAIIAGLMKLLHIV
jgi:hypothetical protein